MVATETPVVHELVRTSLTKLMKKDIGNERTHNDAITENDEGRIRDLLCDKTVHYGNAKMGDAGSELGRKLKVVLTTYDIIVGGKEYQLEKERGFNTLPKNKGKKRIDFCVGITPKPEGAAYGSVREVRKHELIAMFKIPGTRVLLVVECKMGLKVKTADWTQALNYIRALEGLIYKRYPNMDPHVDSLMALYFGCFNNHVAENNVRKTGAQHGVRMMPKLREDGREILRHEQHEAPLVSRLRIE